MSDQDNKNDLEALRNDKDFQSAVELIFQVLQAMYQGQVDIYHELDNFSSTDLVMNFNCCITDYLRNFGNWNAIFCAAADLNTTIINLFILFFELVKRQFKDNSNEFLHNFCEQYWVSKVMFNPESNKQDGIELAILLGTASEHPERLDIINEFKCFILSAEFTLGFDWEKFYNLHFDFLTKKEG